MTAEDLITVHNLHGLPLKIQCMDTIVDVASDTFLYNVQISKLTILPHHKQTLQPSRTLARPQLHLGFLTQEQTTMSHQICQILTTLKHSDSIHVGDGKALPNFHIGSSKVSSPHKNFTFSNILHVPIIKKNLLSVKKFCLENNVVFEFHSFFFVLMDEITKTSILTSPSKHVLFSIFLPQLKVIPKIAFLAIRASSSVWHQRIGHPHQRVFNSIVMLILYQFPQNNLFVVRVIWENLPNYLCMIQIFVAIIFWI